MNDPDRLLRAEEVAAILSVPKSWVRERTRAGEIPCVTLGRYRRYNRAAVLAWVETLTTSNGNATTPRYRKHTPTAPGDGGHV